MIPTDAAGHVQSAPAVVAPRAAGLACGPFLGVIALAEFALALSTDVDACALRPACHLAVAFLSAASASLALSGRGVAD